jgi:meso-butanediol dehydrogenase/(S,S)-butanediol dehydrogenase/diacetyl reductase
VNLEGKTALITGGGTGIGAAIAKRFVADGAKICITGRRESVLKEVAKSMPPDMVSICAGDVSNFADVERMVDTAVKMQGKLDVLVNNAGIDPGGTVTDVEIDQWKQVIEINLIGSFLAMRASIPHMIKAGGGSVINISSLGGIQCLPGMSAYSTSKAAINMLTRQAAVDYGRHKVRCNAVCPGAVRTEMLESALTPLTEVIKTDVDGVFDCIASNVPLGRVAAPDEISGLCSYLASDDSSFMTGSVVLIDGGSAVVDVSGAALTSAGVNWGV